MTAQTAAEAVAGLLVLVLLALVAVAVRRRLLSRRGGTVPVSMRLHTHRPGRGWVLGVGRFTGDELQWYRVFSLAPRPRRRLHRQDLAVEGQRDPQPDERRALLQGAVVLECRSADGPVHIALEPCAVTGFLSWLEAAPPGATLPRV